MKPTDIRPDFWDRWNVSEADEEITPVTLLVAFAIFVGVVVGIPTLILFVGVALGIAP